MWNLCSRSYTYILIQGFGLGFGLGFTKTFKFRFGFHRNRKSGFVRSLLSSTYRSCNLSVNNLCLDCLQCPFLSITSLSLSSLRSYKHTVQNLNFLSKNSNLISRGNCRFFWVKNSWKCGGVGLVSCGELWFHEKNCYKF